MVKKELLAMRQLNVSSKMLRIAQKDVPRITTVKTWRYSYQKIVREYHLYLRCCIENDILKVALYYPDHLRTGGRLPSYEVYIDRSARRFITYDRINAKWLTAKVDRLNWPSNMPEFPNIWMSAADSKAVASYLKSGERGYKAILLYQRELREEARILRNKKETDAWDADMALTPPLPKDWNRWVDKIGIPQNYMFYEYRKGGAKTGYCTYCGKEVPIQSKPIHNKEGRCSRCRHEVTFKAVGRAGRIFTDEVSVYLIQARPDGFILREFWAMRIYQKGKYRTPEIRCSEQRRSICGQDMQSRHYHWGMYKNIRCRWVEGEPVYSWYGYSYQYQGNQKGRVYGKNLSYLAKTALQGTGLAEWIRKQGLVAYPKQYLRILQDIPPLEKILKANLPLLAQECMQETVSVQARIADPKASSLTKVLGIDSQELKRLRRYNGGHRFLGWLQQEKQSGRPIPDDIILWFCQNKINIYDLNFIGDKMNAVQIHNYLVRQAQASGETVQQVIRTWGDYISMAEKLGIDTSDEIIYRAKLLRQRHDELVVRCKQMNKKAQVAEVLKNFPKVDRICQSIKDKYEYANAKYTVIAPDGALDIIVEGDMLCHCLRGSDRYWDRIQTHESYILFLRRASAPDVPYYTLEVEPDGTVRQKQTKFDRQEADIKDAKKFLEEWQQVVAQRLTKGDRKKAEVSRVLREKEFEQMRRDNIMIYTGDLAGRRLVDVLTADLMENAA